MISKSKQSKPSSSKITKINNSDNFIENLWNNLKSFFKEDDKEKIKKQIISMPMNQEFSFTNNNETSNTSKKRRPGTPKFQEKYHLKTKGRRSRSSTAPLKKAKKFLSDLKKGRVRTVIEKNEKLKKNQFSFTKNQLEEECNVVDDDTHIDSLSKKISGFPGIGNGRNKKFEFPRFEKKNSFNTNKIGNRMKNVDKNSPLTVQINGKDHNTTGRNESTYIQTNSNHSSLKQRGLYTPGSKLGSNFLNHKKVGFQSNLRDKDNLKIYSSYPNASPFVRKSTKGLDFSRSKFCSARSQKRDKRKSGL